MTTPKTEPLWWLLLSAIATIIGFIVISVVLMSVLLTAAAFGGWQVVVFPFALAVVAWSLVIRNRRARGITGRKA
jgi:hypothetical protein